MPPIRNYAVLIGVEHGVDQAMSGPDFAAADVRALKTTLETIGYSRKDMCVLAGKGAAKTAVEARLHSLLERAQTHPGSLLFYYAGPGFSVDGINYLACRDTSPDDLEGTSIGLDGLLREIGQAPFSQVQIYLDAGTNSSSSASLEGSPAISPLSEKSLEASLAGVEHLVLFSACRFHEPSYASLKLKHGIWAYHVLEALSGKAPEILTEAGFLSARSLQDLLDERVPRTLRDTYNDRRKRQTPWHGGSSQEKFLVADLTSIAGRSTPSFSALAAVVKDFSFRRQERIRVKTLSGFRQGLHHSPKWSNRQAEEFVARIAHGEIEADLNARFAEIRQNLGYRRRQVEVRPPGDGDASIRTPDFQYTISVGLDEDPALVVITRELSDVHRPEILADDRLARTFDETFDSVRLSFDRPIDVEDLVDLAEAGRMPVAYPPDCSSCTIQAADGATIRVTGSHLLLRYPGGQTLERLTRGLDQIIHLFPKSDSLPAPSTRQR